MVVIITIIMPDIGCNTNPNQIIKQEEVKMMYYIHDQE